VSWTDITRAEHSRQSDRYPTDLTDAEWAMALPLVPPSRAGGRPRTSDMREVMNAILYIAGGGIPWRMLPKDFPAVSTVRGYFYRWRNDGTLALMNFALVQAARELELNGSKSVCVGIHELPPGGPSFRPHPPGHFWVEINSRRLWRAKKAPHRGDVDDAAL